MIRQSISAPAVSVIEVESIVRGYVVVDALMKKANVTLHFAEAVSPGKFIVIFSGDVANTDESFSEAKTVAADLLIDSLHLPFMHAQLANGLAQKFCEIKKGASFGFVETHTAASGILAADIALKKSNVSLIHLHVARGIGGKAWFHIAGELADVEASIAAVHENVGASLLVNTEIIQRPF